MICPDEVMLRSSRQPEANSSSATRTANAAPTARPMIPNGRGIFAEKADARMWLSDDPRHLMLALQSNFSFGQVTLKLKEYSVPEHP